MIQITINPQSPIPIYEQIKERLRLLLLAGTLAAGDQLPSVRQLAVQLTVNPNTVAKVYRELEQEGLLTNHPGKGCFAAVPPGGRRRDERRALIRSEARALAEKARTVGLSVAELLAIIQEESHE
ncbi:MAG: GntR family transcriptional regulator [Acidobacteria bacterium]|nr:GntR family transcriptional regulator [Acidobacteriota bacterium]